MLKLCGMSVCFAVCDFASYFDVQPCLRLGWQFEINTERGPHTLFELRFGSRVEYLFMCQVATRSAFRTTPRLPFELKPAVQTELHADLPCRSMATAPRLTAQRSTSTPHDKAPWHRTTTQKSRKRDTTLRPTSKTTLLPTTRHHTEMRHRTTAQHHTTTRHCRRNQHHNTARDHR